jgi:hypothetical protein
MNPSSCLPNKCRFCYNYKPPGFIDPCCPPQLCATNSYLSSISSLPNVVNNNTRTTEQSLLLAKQRKCLLDTNTIVLASTLEYNIQNSTLISSTLYGQLLNLRLERYVPYQPYIPPVIPSSVIQLQMATVNAGVPMSFFTIADCKGSQFVTT